MYMNISIELYKEDGQKWVYLCDECSDGAKYVYNDKDELKDIINDYIDNHVNELVNDEEEEEDEE